MFQVTDLHARFLPKFPVASRDRIARAQALVLEGPPQTFLAVSGQAHAFAGEAAMRAPSAIESSARAIEDLASGPQAPVEQRVAEACAIGMQRLAHEISVLAAGVVDET